MAGAECSGCAESFVSVESFAKHRSAATAAEVAALIGTPSAED